MPLLRRQQKMKIALANILFIPRKKDKSFHGAMVLNGKSGTNGY
jgi:hypothetical protein